MSFSYILSLIELGVHRLQAGTPGFLKLFLCRGLYACVYVCVHPKTINN